MQRIWYALILGLLGTISASCTSDVPVPPTPPATTSAQVMPMSPSSEPTPALTTTAHPWKAGDFQYGIQLYWHMNASPAKEYARAQQQLNYIASLGANSVGITFSIYTDGPEPTKVYAGPRTPSLRVMKLLIESAHRRGLRVMLRPTIYEANLVKQDPTAWRGNIRPVNIGAWFASYWQLLRPYVSLATSESAEEIALGVELNSLQSYVAQWRQLQDQVRSLGYQGVLSYSYNWDSTGKLPFKHLGVDAYPAIKLGDNASVADLATAMEAWLKSYRPGDRSQLVIQEVGIASLSGMYSHPWYWDPKLAAKPNFQVQANWFAAIAQASRQAGLGGVYYWALDSNMDLDHNDPETDYVGSFVDKPAEQAIRHVFNQQ